LSHITVTRLEKAAVDNGFDLTLPRDDATSLVANFEDGARICTPQFATSDVANLL